MPIVCQICFLFLSFHNLQFEWRLKDKQIKKLYIALGNYNNHYWKRKEREATSLNEDDAESQSMRREGANYNHLNNIAFLIILSVWIKIVKVH